MTIAKVEVRGLREFNRNLKKMDSELPKAVRIALNGAVDIVVGYARPRIPHRTGAASRSLKARSTRTQARVQFGGSKAPYAPWLDFGGRVGRNRSVRRPFLREGRYVYKALAVKRQEFISALEKALVDVASSAGVEVN